jgi:hypothetical protein
MSGASTACLFVVLWAPAATLCAVCGFWLTKMQPMTWSELVRRLAQAARVEAWREKRRIAAIKGREPAAR